MVQVNAKIEINLMLEPSIVKIQHISYSPLYISENMFSNNHMNVFWITHELTKGIYCITNVRSGVY
jgi:hypothetical protein